MSIKIRYFIATLFVTVGTVVMYKTQSITNGFYLCLIGYFVLLISNEFKTKLDEPIKIDLKSTFSSESLKSIAFILVAYLATNYIEKNESILVTKWYFAIFYWLFWISGLITIYRTEIEEKEKIK